MVRPTTRNQRAAAIFNNQAWPVHYDTTLIDSLQRRTRRIADLSSSTQFEAVIEQVHADMVRILRRSITLHEVKVRIESIRRRFYKFMDFTTLPGVHFNRMTNAIRIGPQYTTTNPGETVVQRYFRHYGFPFYETCNEVFEYKAAAAINLQGVAGYNPNDPIEIEDSDDGNNEIVAYEGNQVGDYHALTNMGGQGVSNQDNALAVNQGNPEDTNQHVPTEVNSTVHVDNDWDGIDPMDEFRYGWGISRGSDYSSSGGYHSSDSQNTWSR